MKLNKEIEAHLECVFLQYNCGTKMIGGLRPKCTKNGANIWEHEISRLLNDNKEELISEFVGWLGDARNYPELRDGGHNPLWPNDPGRYPASCLMYADAMNKTGSWFSCFTALIKNEWGPGNKYGVVVDKGPIYLNNYYAKTGIPRFSRLYYIYLPSSISARISGAGTDLRSKFPLLKEITPQYLKQQQFRDDDIKEILDNLAAPNKAA